MLFCTDAYLLPRARQAGIACLSRGGVSCCRPGSCAYRLIRAAGKAQHGLSLWCWNGGDAVAWWRTQHARKTDTPVGAEALLHRDAADVCYYLSYHSVCCSQVALLPQWLWATFHRQCCREPHHCPLSCMVYPQHCSSSCCRLTARLCSLRSQCLPCCRHSRCSMHSP